MNTRFPIFLLLCMSLASSGGVRCEDGPLDFANQWPRWRGPLATGVAPHADPPLTWSETENIRWKIELPGKGHSTPIVWGDRIFLTTAIGKGEAVAVAPDHAPFHSQGAHDNLPAVRRHKFATLAIDRTNGEIVWQKTLRTEIPAEGGHVSASLASNSPVTDGERVYAFFGSRGLYCLDFEGNLLWETDLGEMQTIHGHGEGASPALHGDTLVVNWDHEGPSFLVAFNKFTGEERWRVARDEVSSWSTPIVVEHEGKPQVIVNGTNRVRAYDLATGKVLWECAGLSHNIVASPVAGDGMVYCTSSYNHQAMLAIRLAGAKADVTGSDRIAWTRSRGTPYVPSPLLTGGALYFFHHYQGILIRADAKTGNDGEGPFRLGELREIYASPVAARGRIYITGRGGTTLVLGDAPRPQLLATNHLDDTFNASAALVDGELFLRGEQYFYCIARQ